MFFVLNIALTIIAALIVAVVMYVYLKFPIG